MLTISSEWYFARDQVPESRTTYPSGFVPIQFSYSRLATSAANTSTSASLVAHTWSTNTTLHVFLEPCVVILFSTKSGWKWGAYPLKNPMDTSFVSWGKKGDLLTFKREQLIRGRGGFRSWEKVLEKGITQSASGGFWVIKKGGVIGHFEKQKQEVRKVGDSKWEKKRESCRELKRERGKSLFVV